LVVGCPGENIRLRCKEVGKQTIRKNRSEGALGGKKKKGRVRRIHYPHSENPSRKGRRSDRISKKNGERQKQRIWGTIQSREKKRQGG